MVRLAASWKAVLTALGVHLDNVECAEINHGRCRMEILLVYMSLGKTDPIKHFSERISFCEASVSFWKLTALFCSLSPFNSGKSFQAHTDFNAQPFGKYGCSQMVHTLRPELSEVFCFLKDHILYF